VSTGPVLVAVPNVVGLTQAAASAAITGAGLVVGTVTSASSPTVPAGSVISSTPTAGTQVASGASVDLLISVGSSLVYSGLVQPPIDKDGSSVFSATRASLPVKFSLRTNGASTCELPPATIAVSRIAGGVVGPIDESVFIRPSDKGSTFAISDCQIRVTTWVSDPLEPANIWLKSESGVSRLGRGCSR
jgi:serine/threonine-protein kinase